MARQADAFVGIDAADLVDQEMYEARLAGFVQALRGCRTVQVANAAVA